MSIDQWNGICERWGNLGYESLTRPEKTWLNIRSLIDSIENGGAISYFYNSGADTLSDCLEDLQFLEADKVRAQIDRICDLFPNGVPTTSDDRNAIIDSWSEDDQASETDDLLQEIDELLMPLMPSLEEQLEGFLGRSGLAT